MTALARFRESLALVLIALLPLHAIAVTVITHLFDGSGRAPLLAVAVWKEVILGILCVVVLVEIVFRSDSSSESRVWSLDPLDWCILLALVIAVLVSTTSSDFFTLLSGNLSLEDRKFLVGFKYDFLPLIIFFLLRRVPWTKDFHRSASWVLIGVGVLIALVGLVALKLPMSFFVSLGYSDLHSLYRPHAPLAAFQMIDGTTLRRAQSVMSGPNQFGLWLLIPLAASLQWIAITIRRRQVLRGVGALMTLLLLLTALVFTYSRSAWLGAALLSILFLLWLIRSSFFTRRLRFTLLATFGVCLALGISLGVRFAPEIVVRTQSFIGHLEKPIQAIAILREHPLGLGLASAGPASNRYSDTCLFFDLGADVSWARKRTDLCIFVGGVRKLPPGKVCECPLLTENWYLQWGVEMGIAGLVLSLLITLLPLLSVRWISPLSPRAFPLLALSGVALGGMFLHAFEDSAVAYTLWILLAAAELRMPDIDDEGHLGSSATLRP